MVGIRGYKIFDKDYTCRGYKYSLDKPNIYEGELKSGESGFHFCPNASDCETYYSISDENTFAIVESGEKYIVKDDKVVCRELRIVETLTYHEWLLLTRKNIRCKVANGKFHGKYKEFSPFNKQTFVKANYNEGVLHGSYEQYVDGKLIVRRTYVDGKLTGNITEYYSDDGIIKRVLPICDGIINGESVEYYLDGSIKRKIMYVDGYRHGEYTEYNIYGNILIKANYHNGKFKGKYTTYHDDGRVDIELNYD